jgi:hypothetical protein
MEHDVIGALRVDTDSLTEWGSPGIRVNAPDAADADGAGSKKPPI